MSTRVVDQLGFQVSGRRLVDGISFALPEGQLFSIVGPNGAGKSTLLKMLARVLEPSSGTIKIAEQAVSALTPAQHAQLIGYVPQALETDYHHEVFDFVLMGLYPAVGRWERIDSQHEQLVLEALELVDMLPFSARPLRTLSGGERQRVLLASALVHRPKLLLLDEPTTFLDPRHEFEIETLLADIRIKTRVSILSVTHQLNSCALRSDFILGMRDGQIAFAGPSKDFMQSEVLQRIFGFEFQLIRHPHMDLNMVVPAA